MASIITSRWAFGDWLACDGPPVCPLLEFSCLVRREARVVQDGGCEIIVSDIRFLCG